MWRHLNIRKIFGIVAAVTGVAVLIIGLPSWIWVLATGAFLIFFGWMLYTTNK